jgi:hypothetical protein
MDFEVPPPPPHKANTLPVTPFGREIAFAKFKGGRCLAGKKPDILFTHTEYLLENSRNQIWEQAENKYCGCCSNEHE